MRFSYRTQQWLPYPVEQVFDFFASPHNLPLLMPEWQRARIDTLALVAAPPRPATSGSMSAAAGIGTRFTLSFVPFPHCPVRIRWQAEIDDFKWDEYFCDRQLRGPFAYWNHRHIVRGFHQPGYSGTVVADEVEYEMPFGVAGRLAHRLLVRRQIERSFSLRQGELARILFGVKSQLRPQGEQ